MPLASRTQSPVRRTIARPVWLFVVSLFFLIAGAGVASQTAWAAVRTIAVANSTISCTQVSGWARFEPRLHTRGTSSGVETVHLNIALDGCVSPSLPPPIRISGTLTGALVTDTGTSCTTSLGAVARTSVGTLTAKWKTHGAKIGTSSSFAPERIRPVKLHGKKNVNQAVKIGGPGSPRPAVVGDFTGGNGGRGSSFTLTWKQSAATCAVGLSSLPIISGSLTFS